MSDKFFDIMYMLERYLRKLENCVRTTGDMLIEPFVGRDSLAYVLVNFFKKRR